MKSAMSLSRFEAFSDGVFAIAHQSPDALPFTQSTASNDATELPSRALAPARLAQRHPAYSWELRQNLFGQWVIERR